MPLLKSCDSSYGKKQLALAALTTLHKSDFSLLIFDVDHFKKFNDTYGHLAGDAVICSVAQTLDELSREMDLVARYGDEFR